MLLCYIKFSCNLEAMYGSLSLNANWSIRSGGQPLLAVLGNLEDQMRKLVWLEWQFILSEKNCRSHILGGSIDTKVTFHIKWLLDSYYLCCLSFLSSSLMNSVNPHSIIPTKQYNPVTKIESFSLYFGVLLHFWIYLLFLYLMNSLQVLEFTSVNLAVV